MTALEALIVVAAFGIALEPRVVLNTTIGVVFGTGQLLVWVGDIFEIVGDRAIRAGIDAANLAHRIGTKWK